MTVDVEMKYQPTPPNSVSSAVPPEFHQITSVVMSLKEIASLIETGSYAQEVRRISRAVRLTIALRKRLATSIINAFLDFALGPSSEARTRLAAYVSKDDEWKLILSHLAVRVHQNTYQKQYKLAKACSSASIARLKSLNRRTVDVLASRLYFYYSYSYEVTGDLAEIRGDLLALHRIATLRHDELGQETLLNLLLRNYLHYSLYDQAEKLRSKAPRFEAHSNQQFC
ncbi:hypothetical protein MLD38_012836 [Melastoma candidum]|uniref:Uncharacterized protein n=1 Tax=Melastoma candidum TaxID=119954 RepID=A0ACB9RBT2_9MYRT|nr:hypothetical protein MLD38_012836 [Melastoma candidum]